MLSSFREHTHNNGKGMAMLICTLPVTVTWCQVWIWKWIATMGRVVGVGTVEIVSRQRLHVLHLKCGPDITRPLRLMVNNLPFIIR